MTRRMIVFHIGLERTGTKSIQAFCVRNRKELQRQSILYPTSAPAFVALNHIGLVSSYLPSDARDYFVNSPGGKAPALTCLQREIEACEAGVVFLSSEHFSSRFRRPQIAELAADFSQYDCRVALVLREHLSRFYSIYATHIASGGRATIDEFAEWVLADDSVELRYTNIIEAWQEAFGAANVKFTVFDGGRDAVLSFFGTRGPMPLAVDLRPMRGPGPFGRRANRSLGPEGTVALRKANRLAARLVSSNSAFAMAVKHSIWVAVRGALHLTRVRGSRNRDQPEDRAWGLAAELRRRLVEVAAADAMRLRERFGVSLPPVE
jgi:hypothetical protein